MFNLVASLFTSLAITLFAIPSIIRVAELKNLFDEPDARKIHGRKVPTLGGMAIFAGLLFSVTFWTNQSQIAELQFIIAALLILFFIGIKDDLVNLRAWKKLAGQLLAAVILVHFAEIRLTTFYGLFGIRHIPEWFGYAITIFTVVVVTNAYNLIDGIDGLAGSLGILGATTFGLWYYFLGMTQYTIPCAALVGALLGFLWYNRTPARIFMGDTGSLLVGFIMALLAVKFIESVRILPRTHPYKILSVPVFTCAVLVVPLFDTLRVFAIRLLKRRSPFHPDRNRIHHILIDLGLSHLGATAALFAFNLLIIVAAFASQGVRGEILLVGLVAIPTLLSVLLSRSRDRRLERTP